MNPRPRPVTSKQAAADEGKGEQQKQDRLGKAAADAGKGEKQRQEFANPFEPKQVIGDEFAAPDPLSPPRTLPAPSLLSKVVRSQTRPLDDPLDATITTDATLTAELRAAAVRGSVCDTALPSTMAAASARSGLSDKGRLEDKRVSAPPKVLKAMIFSQGQAQVIED